MYIPQSMAIEYKNHAPEIAAELDVNPNACEAVVEVEVFSEYGQTEIAGTEMSCKRCNLHQRFTNIGTGAEILTDVRSEIAVVVGAKCLKIRSSVQDTPQELLPQPRLL